MSEGKKEKKGWLERLGLKKPKEEYDKEEELSDKTALFDLLGYKKLDGEDDHKASKENLRKHPSSDGSGDGGE